MRQGGASRVAFGQQVCSQVKSSGGIIGTADTPQLVLALVCYMHFCTGRNTVEETVLGQDFEQKPTQLQCTECQR